MDLQCHSEHSSPTSYLVLSNSKNIEDLEVTEDTITQSTGHEWQIPALVVPKLQHKWILDFVLKLG